MEHAEVRKKLSEYLDGVSSQDERAGIEAHLQGCDRCNSTLAELEKTVSHLRGLPREEPPPWLTGRIMARVRAEVEKPSLWQRLFYSCHIKLPIEALALVALCVTGYYIARTTSPTVPLTSPQVLERGASPLSDQAPAKAGDTGGPRDRAPSVPAGMVPGAKAPATSERALDMPPPAPGFAAPPPRLPATTPASATIPPEPATKSFLPSRTQTPPPVSGAAAPAREMQERIRPDAVREERDISPGMMQRPAARARKSMRTEAAGEHGGRHEAESPAVAPRTIVLWAASPAIAGDEVARTVSTMGGVLVRREPGITGERLSVRIGATRFGEFLDRLEEIGRIAKKPALREGGTGVMELLVEIEPDR